MKNIEKQVDDFMKLMDDVKNLLIKHGYSEATKVYTGGYDVEDDYVKANDRLSISVSMDGIMILTYFYSEEECATYFFGNLSELKKFMVNHKREIVLTATEEGYSRDAYTEAGWKSIAKYLLSQGHSIEQSAAFMNSKHMRWARDHNSTVPYGEHTLATVKKYFTKCPKYNTSEELNSLI